MIEKIKDLIIKNNVKDFYTLTRLARADKDLFFYTFQNRHIMAQMLKDYINGNKIIIIEPEQEFKDVYKQIKTEKIKGE